MQEQDYQTGYQEANVEPETGPLRGVKQAFRSLFGPGQSQPKRAYERVNERGERDHIGEMKDKVADFDEDYRDIGERALGFFMQVVGYVGPFVLVLAIGTELGAFYVSTGALPMSSYLIAYGIECTIAALTVAIGRGLSELDSGKGVHGKLTLAIVGWFVLNFSSAYSLFMVLTNNGHIAPGVYLNNMLIRVTAIALCDFGCAIVLMFKGRSIQKYIDAIHKKARELGRLAEAERAIADAEARAKRDEQEADLSFKIREMMHADTLEKMRGTDKHERGYRSRS